MDQLVKESNGAVAGARRIRVRTSGATTSAATTTIAPISGAQPAVSNKNIENAVYGHLRAVRALGRTEILPSEIAAALSIPTSAVIEALTNLQSKGVKFNK